MIQKKKKAKKILVRDPALRKAVRKKFTNNYDADKAFFKKIMGKSLGINDNVEHNVKKQ